MSAGDSFQMFLRKISQKDLKSIFRFSLFPFNFRALTENVCEINLISMVTICDLTNKFLVVYSLPSRQHHVINKEKAFNSIKSNTKGIAQHG